MPDVFVIRDDSYEMLGEKSDDASVGGRARYPLFTSYEADLRSSGADFFSIDSALAGSLPASESLLRYSSFLARFPPFRSPTTRALLALHPLPPRLRADHFLAKIRLARVGDGSALFWLAQHSDVGDALRWLERLESFPVNTFYHARFLKAWIVVKGVFTYSRLSEFDKLILKMIISPIYNDLLILIATVLFVFFVAIRVHYYLS